MIQRLKQWWPLMRKATYERRMLEAREQAVADLAEATGKLTALCDKELREQKRRLADSHEKEMLALAARLDPLIGRLMEVDIREDPVKGLYEHRRWHAVVSIDDRLMFMAQTRGERQLAYQSIAHHVIHMLQDQFGRGTAE